MGKLEANDLKKSFRVSRGQEEMSLQDEKKISKVFCSVVTEKPSGKKQHNQKNGYASFLEKYYNIETRIYDFTVRDVLYFFEEKKKESNIKYAPSMGRDTGALKLACKNYSVFDVLKMIEFVFDSGQKYLDVYTVQPTVFVSSFANRIYQDTLLYVEGVFDGENKRVRLSKNQNNSPWKSESKTGVGEVELLI